MNDEKYLSIVDAQQTVREKLMAAENAEDIKNLAEADAALQKVQTEEVVKEQEVLNKKSEFKTRIGEAIIGGICLILAGVASQFVKGEYDMTYLFADWEQNKTEKVIARHNIRRPK